MKIIEKKCPNCGASLTFENTDKEAKCNYCGQEFVIENDSINKPNINIDDLLSKNFKLHKKIIKTFSIVHIFVTIFIIATIVTMTVIVFKGVSSQFSKTPEVKIEQIDKDTFTMIHSTSVDILGRWSGIVANYKRGNFEYVGAYIYKDTFGTKLSDVFKVTYTNSKDNTRVDVFTLVTYRSVELKDGKVSLDYNGTACTNSITLGDSTFGRVNGYRSLKELYNKAILVNAEGKIYSTSGLYNE